MRCSEDVQPVKHERLFQDHENVEGLRVILRAPKRSDLAIALRITGLSR